MEKSIGIYFASKHGQTEKIARYLGECFTDRGWDVYVSDLNRTADGTPQVSNFTAVLIGAPLYRQNYPKAVRDFIAGNRMELIGMPATGFFSTCLAATPGTRDAYLESLEPARKFLDDVSWTPDWIASFPGALNYLDYDPMTRWLMKRVSRSGGGPTDTTRNHELTRWEEVSRFARDFDEASPGSPYRAETMSFATRTLNMLMPVFEQRLVQEITVEASRDEIRSAIESVELSDMPLAGILAWIRNFGRASEQHPVTFQQAAAAFGVVPIATKQRNEIAGGLIGQFWKRDYGIERIRNEGEFEFFLDPGYTKAITSFWFDELRDGKTVVRTETRIHSLGHTSRRRFHAYWSIAGVGIRLYMASTLRGIARCASRQRRERRAVAA